MAMRKYYCEKCDIKFNVEEKAEELYGTVVCPTCGDDKDVIER